MLNGKRLLQALVFFASSALLLVGCHQGFNSRMGKPDRGLTFRSPLAPHEGTIASPEEIRSILARRSRPVQGLRARLEILVGESGRHKPRQRFEALAYIDPPDFLRVRASQNGSTVFDLLIDGQRAQAIIVPERMALLGSTRELNESPQATLGVPPALLFEAVNVEATLVEKLGREKCDWTAERGGYRLRFATAKGYEEFVLRREDLLVQRIAQWVGRKKAGEVRFWAYETLPSQGLIATEFAVENAAGGAALFRLSDVRLNEPRTPALATLEIPAEFQQHTLRRTSR